MKITKLMGGAIGTNCYILTDEETMETAVVDPGFVDEELISALEEIGLEHVTKILLTHGHFDHIMGVPKMKELTGAKVYIHADDVLFTSDPSLNLAGMISAITKPFSADVTVNDGDTIPLGRLTIRVLHTPGHTIGSCCFIVENAIFTGDTLMKLSCGRTDFPTGSYPQMMASLQRLCNLEGDYNIYPGHEGSTTLNYERKNNPFVGN